MSLSLTPPEIQSLLTKLVSSSFQLPSHLRKELEQTQKELSRRFRDERSRYWNPTIPPLNDQKGLYESTAKIQFGGGGNRSGKTETGAMKAYSFCIGTHPTLSQKRAPPVYGRYCGETWEDGIKEVVLKKFKQIVRRDQLYGGSWDTAWSEKSRSLSFCLDGDRRVRGSIIRFYTYQQSVATYAGDDLDFVVMDEHAQKKYYTENIARLTDRNGWMLLTMTPEAGISWESEEILDRAADGDEDYVTFRFDSRLNPYLSKEGLATLIKTLKSDPQLMKAKIEGRFVALEGLIYPMFNENIHIVDDNPDLIKNCHRSIVIDVHLQKATAIGWYAWTKHGYCYKYRDAEWTPDSNGIKGLASFIRIKSESDKITDWIMDESMGGTPDEEQRNVFGEKTVITQLNECGLPFMGTNKISSKAVNAGILKVKDMLRIDPISNIPRFRLFQSCQNTAKQYRFYQFRKKTLADEETFRERIRKIRDDHVDNDRYALMAEPTWNMPEAPPPTHYDPDSGEPMDYNPDYRSPFGEGELS